MPDSRRTPLPVATNARVYLRFPSLRDASEFLDLNRRSTRHFRGVAAPVTGRHAFAAYVRRSRTTDFTALLVCRRADDAIVGNVNLGQIVRGIFKSAYMGYQVFAPFANQGYMKAAMPLVLRFVFGTLKLHRVEANIQPTNTASLAVVRRAGFRKEGYSPRYLKIAGRWRDHERWTMTIEDWKASRQKKRTR